MRYFAYLAEQSFKVAPDGKRLFYRGGFWTRPYIIPDSATEQQLFTKQLWMLRLLLGSLILGQPFLFILVPALVLKPIWFLVYPALLLATSWLVGIVVFRRDLRRLVRAESRLPLQTFFGTTAKRHGTGALLLGLIGSLLFVAGGLWMLAAGHNSVLGCFCVGFFGLCSAAWGYTLILKIRALTVGRDVLPD